MTRGRLLRPDIHTEFHIDLGWWERMGRDFRLYLRDALCPECREAYADLTEVQEVDWVAPDTAEVRRLDKLWVRILDCCSQKVDYINPGTPLAAAIFRALLANGNRPLSPVELYERIGKSTPQTILRILVSRIHYGVVPVNRE
jgi:hypothetical protein